MEINEKLKPLILIRNYRKPLPKWNRPIQITLVKTGVARLK